MRRIVFLFMFFGIFNNYIIAQQNENQIDLRFKGGEIALRQFLQKKLMYPINSMSNKSIGYSIAGITVTPKGEIEEITIINSVDKWIDKTIIKILKLTRNNWIPVDSINTNQTFYIQVIFNISGSNYVENLKTIETGQYNFIKSIVVNTFGEIPESNVTIAGKSDKYIKQSKYKKALICINELIERYPFEKQYYQIRMFLNKKLQNNELIIEDSQKINNFIPGISLDNLQI